MTRILTHYDIYKDSTEDKIDDWITFQYVFRFFKHNEKYSTYKKKMKSKYFITTRNTIDRRQAKGQSLIVPKSILSLALYN